MRLYVKFEIAGYTLTIGPAQPDEPKTETEIVSATELRDADDSDNEPHLGFRH